MLRASNMGKVSTMYKNYFSEATFSHLRPQQGLSERHQRRALDVTLACKLTHVYGKYHLAMLHRELAMSEEQTTYQQAERQAAMMRSTLVASLAKNLITVFNSSPSDFIHTQEESTDESIDTYKEFKHLLEEYSDEQFVPNIVEQFCKMVYEDEEYFIFFKLSATCISLSMPMRCYGFSRAKSTTTLSARNVRN